MDDAQKTRSLFSVGISSRKGTMDGNWPISRIFLDTERVHLLHVNPSVKVY